MRNDQYLFADILHFRKMHFFTFKIHVYLFSPYLTFVFLSIAYIPVSVSSMSPSYEIREVHSYKDELV